MIEARKKFRVSVVIPAYNEENNIEKVINAVKKRKEVDEVIVVDDGSIDSTSQLANSINGVKVITLQKNQGKGYAMKTGAAEALGDIILFIDADYKNINHHIIEAIIEPFKEMCDFVKTTFDRNGGRVTLLTAKPLLEHFFPKIAQRFEQPLSGQVGIRRELFEKMNLEPDYGVEIGMLIDAVEMGAEIKEVHIGNLDHNERALEDLDVTAKEVTRAILDRAVKYRRPENTVGMINP